MVLVKEKEIYQFWLSLYKDLPRVERLSMGKKIDSAILDMLEYTFVSIYLQPEQKIAYLDKTITKLDIVKFFSQIAWENKFIPTSKYSDFALKLQEIGRQLGGWKKGLQTKTPRV